MGKIHTKFVGDAHSYTRSKSRWKIDAAARSTRDKLYHYISGGGLSAFGRTIAQEEQDEKQTKFLIASGVLFAIWLLLLIV